jgi:hypothetical protein
VRRHVEVVPGRVADTIDIRSELSLVQVQLKDPLPGNRVGQLLGQDGVQSLADWVLRMYAVTGGFTQLRLMK